MFRGEKPVFLRFAGQHVVFDASCCRVGEKRIRLSSPHVFC
jgi:hypothetical protein